MLFFNFELNKNEPVYIQIKNYIEDLITKGLLPINSKLPSTRELCSILNVSRNSVLSAYEELKTEGLVYSIKGQGTFVKEQSSVRTSSWNVDWSLYENEYTKNVNKMDSSKNEITWKSNLISFKSISPAGDQFDMEELKRAFLNRFNLEGHKLLNYGYAQGYKPLIEFLIQYMNKKNVDSTNKDILVTNGFTEALNIIISSLTKPGDYILCENPTHNVSLKIFKSYNLNILPMNLDKNNLDFESINDTLKKYKGKIKFVYITPSYNNPTGIVLSPEDRFKFYNIMKENNIAIIEDGFNEELLYSSSHIFPICSLDNKNNGVIYIGSFSKILFPGMRIGWIFGDKNLIDRLVSVKRSINMHVSFLDQGILYDYLKNSNFDKYLKKIRKYYGDKFNFALQCSNKYIDYEYVLGDGGLHLFFKLKDIDTRYLLQKCYEKGVIFMPGDVFFINENQNNFMRLGFSRLEKDEIEKGIKIIGETIDEIKKSVL